MLLARLNALNSKLSFRPLRRSDYPALARWLCAPHVACWWNEAADLESIEKKYGPRIDGAEPVRVLAIEQNDQAIGWIQWYRWADYPQHARQLGAEPGSAGIDLAIGEADRIGLGVGPQAISSFIQEIVFSNPDIVEVMVDPEDRNIRSLRAFQKAGFQSVKKIQLDGEQSARLVLRLHRVN